MLEVKGLTRIYRNGRGVRNATFHAGAGEVVALLGPNGAGKTTVLKGIAGFLAPDSGSARLDGISVPDSPALAMRRIGVMIGEPAPFRNMTGIGFLRLHAGLYPGVDEARMQEALRLVGLEDRQKERIRRYSTGMVQRILLARALMHRPDLLLLDEPFSGMDIEGRAALVRILKELVRDSGTSIVISSHQIHDIETLTDRVCILSEGRWMKTVERGVALEQNGSLEEYYLAATTGREEIA